MQIKFFTLFLLLFGISSPAFSQINWQSTNGPEGGGFSWLNDDGQYAYVTNEFYTYRTNNGINWEQLPYGNVWPLATSPTKIAGGQGYGYGETSDAKFIVSYDHGGTWIEGTLPGADRHITSLAVCSHGIYVPNNIQNYMFKSQDDGLTWDTIPAPGLHCSRVWAFDDRLYTEQNGRFWRLALNGTDWEVVSPNVGSGTDLNNMFASDSLLFFTSNQFFWCSSDSGNTWTKTAVANSNSLHKFCKIGNRIYKNAAVGGIIYTDDFGHTWQTLPVNKELRAANLATAGGHLLCGSSDKGVLRYDTTNQQLIPSNDGVNSEIVKNLDSGNGALWTAGGNGVFSYDLVQETWKQAPLPFVPYYYEGIAANENGKIMASSTYTEYLYISTDNGTTWDSMFIYDPVNWASVNVQKMHWLGDHILVTSDIGDGAWSPDFGQTWAFGYYPTSIAYFNGLYYGIRFGGVFSSSDFGNSWQPVSALYLPYIESLHATDDRLFAVVYNSSLGKSTLYSTTDLNNWTYSGDGLPPLLTQYEYYYRHPESVWRRGDRYYFHNARAGFYTSLDTCKTWLPIDRLQGAVEVSATDSSFFTAYFGSGVLKTGLPQNYGVLSRGGVFKDDNNNGIWDTNEIPLPDWTVKLHEPRGWHPIWSSNTNADGQYLISSSAGSNDTLKVETATDYVENINPPFYLVTESSNTRNFGVHFKPNITDVSIGGNLAGRPRPGFPLSIYLEYNNVGTLVSDGKVSVKLDPAFQYTDAQPAPSSTVGTDSLIWDFNHIPLWDRQHIQINGNLNTTTVIGTAFKITGHIEPSSPDFMPGNNHFIRCDTVVGSYDPNEKRVEPELGLTAEEIATGKELLYTVHFQNTGTYQADRVRITDLLDTALNVNTLRLVTSSHAVTSFKLLPGNLLEVLFDHIALPDSNSNEPASHGFVTFAIQRNKYYHPADKVKNTAAIYFDFNEPIITNTVTTAVITPVVSSEEPFVAGADLALLIAPNPTAKDAIVQTQGLLTGKGRVELVNAQGVICVSKSVSDLSNPINIETTNLPGGLYMVRATGQRGILTGKLVITR
jgi:uncharacterized repeat protein (TIGR01451 family)